MKKLTGWIVIVFCSGFLLTFAIALVILIPDMMSKNSEGKMSIQEILNSSLGFVIVISLTIVGLRNGLKKIKKDKVIKIVEYEKTLNINLTGQIEYSDYRNLILNLNFKNPTYLVVFGIMFLFLLTLVVNGKNMMNQFDSNLFIYLIITVFLLLPVLTLTQIKKLYKTNKIFHEKLNYYITNDSINIKGNTVDSTQKWTHFYQIRVTKNFFMFYHGKMVATLLDKKMFTETELKEFNKFIKSLNVERV